MALRRDVRRATAVLACSAAVALGGCSGSEGGAGLPLKAAPAPAGAATTPSAPQQAEANTDAVPLPSAPPAPAAPALRALARAGEYVFPIRGCRATYGRTHHDYPASDIFADAGCPVVSVTAGIVDEVSRRDTWTAAGNDGATRGGLSVSVVGDDGVRYYYSHLSAIDPAVAAGAPVAPGARLGSVGTTGSARHTPPHLHFGLSWPTRAGAWWVRRGVLQPAPYLDAWKSGEARSARARILRLRDERGELPRCARAC